MRILVIEDDLDIAGNVGDYLQSRGHLVDFAYDGVSGMHLALTQDFDALVVDWMLPGMSGLDLCRRLRSEAGDSVPALMLTARDTLADKLEGFDAGVDDYLVKPFALQELEARLGALDRRHRAARRILRVADLELDTDARRVQRAGHSLQVQGAAFDILALLMERSPAVVRREELEARLWGDERPESDVLRSYVYALRSAIDKPFDRALLHTVRGHGYQLVSAD
ncbi:MAG: response regulator transcription factor [Acidobacteriota bacterium]